jgi:hypothetical protein
MQQGCSRSWFRSDRVERTSKGGEPFVGPDEDPMMPNSANVSSVFLLSSMVTVLVIIIWGLNARLVHRRQRARLAHDGVQEAAILVRQGFHPSLVRVYAHEPVRLTFHRSDDRPYMAHVHLEEPSLSRFLPLHASSTMVFTPQTTGRFLFTCDEGRYCGHLIVDTQSRFATRRCWLLPDSAHRRASGATDCCHPQAVDPRPAISARGAADRLLTES